MKDNLKFNQEGEKEEEMEKRNYVGNKSWKASECTLRVISGRMCTEMIDSRT